MELAKRSHGNVLGAMGLGRSGNQKVFEQDFEADRAAVAGLAAELKKRRGP